MSQHLIISTTENIKYYYKYEDGLISFKTQTYNNNVKIEKIISEEDE